MNIKQIKIEDKNYPQKLKNIYMPPKVLYILGNEKILTNNAIAIIGCRDCTSYGKNIAYNFAREFANKDIVVISGLARGIDAMAHMGAVSICT